MTFSDRRIPQSVVLFSVLLASLAMAGRAAAGGFFPFGCTQPIHLTRDPAKGLPMQGAITVVPIYIGVPGYSYESEGRGIYTALHSTNYLGWLGIQYGAGSIAGPSQYDYLLSPHTFTSSSITATQIAGELQWQLSNSGASNSAHLPANDIAHTIYAVHVSSPYTAIGSNGIPLCTTDSTGTGEDAYHNSTTFSGGTIVFTVIPDYSDSSTGCYNPFAPEPPPGGWEGAQSIAESHELAEALTRPGPGGWVSGSTCHNEQDAEIADICVGNNVSVTDSSGAQWWFQALWSNVANQCVCPVGNGSPCGAMGAYGDIDDDGRADVALLGSTGDPAYPSGNIPVALGADSAWTLKDYVVDDGDFLTWAKSSLPVVGDFNGDGAYDIALTRGPGWKSIPVGMVAGPALFQISNHTGESGMTTWPSSVDFPTFATQTAYAPVAGDFDGDGYADIALAGGTGWNTIPIAYSDGSGAFFALNNSSPGSAYLDYFMSSSPGGQLLSGDFNGDGFSDLAYIVNGAVIVATSRYQAPGTRSGTFDISAQSVYTDQNNGVQSGFTGLAAGALAVTGDFNGDGLTDIALTGGYGWNTIPIAYSANGSFWFNNAPDIGDFQSVSGVAQTEPLKVVAGDWAGNGFTSLALTGVSGWNTMPQAIPFNLYGLWPWVWWDENPGISAFPALSTQSTAHAVSASQAWR